MNRYTNCLDKIADVCFINADTYKYKYALIKLM